VSATAERSTALPESAAVLEQAGSENFPVASRLLPRRQRAHLMALYGYARLVDDAGDEASGDRSALLAEIEADLDRVYAGQAPVHPLLRGLAATVVACDLPRAPLQALVAANRQDQAVHAYATFGDLLAYCELSANPVGRLVLSVTGTSTPERVRLSDAICTALQIVEHLQDVAEDLGRDRIYLPAEDMKQFHVQEADLATPSASASVRALVAHEAQRARDLLNEGAPLVGSVHGRLKLLLAGFVAGGRAAIHAIAAAEYDVLPGPPRPGKGRLLREVGVTLRGEG
jgi:squalene synthase HpnC